MNARCAPKSCQNSPKPARFSPKTARVFDAQRTARSPDALPSTHALFVDLRAILNMLCARCACVTRRFCIEINAKNPKIAQLSPKNPHKSARNERQTRGTRTKNLLCCSPCHAEQRRGLRAAAASHARAVRSKSLQKFAETRAVSAENRAHF